MFENICRKRKRAFNVPAIFRGIKMALNPFPSPAPLTEFETNQSATEQWCSTQLKVNKVSFIWTINNFSQRQEEVGEFLNSSTFSAGSDDKLKWSLRLYPKGAYERSVKYLSLFLKLVSCNKTEVRALYEISIINARKEKVTMKNSEVHIFTQRESWGYGKFIRRDYLLAEANRLLPDKKLTLYCEVSVVTDSINISGPNSAIQFKVPECDISDDLGQLFHGQKFSDVTLSVNGREFAAHKAILAARSPVFSAMFEHAMEEKRKNRVEITDMDHEVLREMLHYIYTSKVSNIENMNGDLLAAADKYALDRLKVMCEEHISSSLSVYTAAEVLNLAHMHSADQLKAHVIDFISMHATDVIDTAGWKTMMQTRPHPVADAFEVFATQHIPQIENSTKSNRNLFSDFYVKLLCICLLFALYFHFITAASG